MVVMSGMLIFFLQTHRESCALSMHRSLSFVVSSVTSFSLLPFSLFYLRFFSAIFASRAREIPRSGVVFFFFFFAVPCCVVACCIFLTTLGFPLHIHGVGLLFMVACTCIHGCAGPFLLSLCLCLCLCFGCRSNVGLGLYEGLDTESVRESRRVVVSAEAASAMRCKKRSWLLDCRWVDGWTDGGIHVVAVRFSTAPVAVRREEKRRE